MDIRKLFSSRPCSRSGGRSSLPPEHTQGFRDNAAMNARIQRDIDRETIYVDGPISPELQAYLDAPVVWRVVGREELDELNAKSCNYPVWRK